MRDTFFVPASRHFEKNKLPLAATFVKTLEMRGGTMKPLNIMADYKYLAALDKEINAALDECGIGDAKVRKDVKDAMHQRARADLAVATCLKDLSKRIAEAKAEAMNIAREFLPQPPNNP